MHEKTVDRLFNPIVSKHTMQAPSIAGWGENITKTYLFFAPLIEVF
jgi:hypothetical protein